MLEYGFEWLVVRFYDDVVVTVQLLVSPCHCMNDCKAFFFDLGIVVSF